APGLKEGRRQARKGRAGSSSLRAASYKHRGNPGSARPTASDRHGDPGGRPQHQRQPDRQPRAPGDGRPAVAAAQLRGNRSAWYPRAARPDGTCRRWDRRGLKPADPVDGRPGIVLTQSESKTLVHRTSAQMENPNNDREQTVMRPAAIDLVAGRTGLEAVRLLLATLEPRPAVRCFSSVQDFLGGRPGSNTDCVIQVVESLA